MNKQHYHHHHQTFAKSLMEVTLLVRCSLVSLHSCPFQIQEGRHWKGSTKKREYPVGDGYPEDGGILVY